MLETMNYSFRNPKNIIWVIYRIKHLRNYKKNHGVLRGPQLGKKRWRARLGILRVKIKNISEKVVEKIKIHILCSATSLRKLEFHWNPTRATSTLRGGADKSLVRLNSWSRKTESIFSLERGVCSCAELQVCPCYRRWKEACQATHAISTISRRELSSCVF